MMACSPSCSDRARQPACRPRRLVELADRITEAFGGRRLNPDSPADVVQAFTRAGLPISSARSAVLRRLDHPAVAPLLEYKELSRLYAANGWSWLDTWVSGGRFRPDWVVGGVVSGRWASRGGGALQIPHALRRAVIAEPGHALVVADAAQLEPRILAALAGDERMAQAATASDLYSALAADSFGGDRSRAKVAMLGTLYGATSGDAAPVLGVLRRRFPTAVAYVEAAARDGETGRLVRSRLGRTCPPPSSSWREAQERASLPGAGAPEQSRARQTARDRGRFTRNFVVQASAADWTAVMLAALRRRLLDGVSRRARRSCSSSTTRSSCTARRTSVMRLLSASPSLRRRRPGCCSGRRRSASRSRARSSPATPTPSSSSPLWTERGPQRGEVAAERRGGGHAPVVRQSERLGKPLSTGDSVVHRSRVRSSGGATAGSTVAA